jgi:hypothetical protein
MVKKSTQPDWLEQTWEIKRKLAEQYSKMTPSAQLKEMTQQVRCEWERRGWSLLENPPLDTAGIPSSPTSAKTNNKSR